LRLGHRETVDFGFYTPDEGFDRPEPLCDALAVAGDLVVTRTAPGTLLGTLGGVNVSFFRYRYDRIDPLDPLLGSVRIAGLRDLAAMKAIAVSQRGLRRDFIDLFFLLRAGLRLDEILRWAREKYCDVAYSEYHLRRALVYFDDADAHPMPKMRLPVEWDGVRRAIAREVAALPPL
jgi:hypothetical protein